MNAYIKREDAINALIEHDAICDAYSVAAVIRMIPFATGLCGVWVPADTPPECEDRVICQTRTKKGAVNMVIGYHDGERWCCGMNSNVEAWTPLPEEYEPKEIAI